MPYKVNHTVKNPQTHSLDDRDHATTGNRRRESVLGGDDAHSHLRFADECAAVSCTIHSRSRTELAMQIHTPFACSVLLIAVRNVRKMLCSCVFGINSQIHTLVMPSTLCCGDNTTHSHNHIIEIDILASVISVAQSFITLHSGHVPWNLSACDLFKASTLRSHEWHDQRLLIRYGDFEFTEYNVYTDISSACSHPTTSKRHWLIKPNAAERLSNQPCNIMLRFALVDKHAHRRTLTQKTQMTMLQKRLVFDYIWHMCDMPLDAMFRMVFPRARNACMCV